uniref:Nuclear cap-binding protein subunit 2 n=1 Tax=Gasterosteus aculeatus aculeatus TaxID=481459 RepID=A0AAQ4S3N5_GASAC
MRTQMTEGLDIEGYYYNAARCLCLQGNRYDQEKLLKQSHTLYVGNLSFYSTEDQVHEIFSKSGDVKRIVIGLDKVKKTACGFCFVEYYTRTGAENAMRFINGTRLDDRIIRTDWDAGFKEGRQYGRGKSGGQVSTFTSKSLSNPLWQPLLVRFTLCIGKQARHENPSPFGEICRFETKIGDLRESCRFNEFFFFGRGGIHIH